MNVSHISFKAIVEIKSGLGQGGRGEGGDRSPSKGGEVETFMHNFHPNIMLDYTDAHLCERIDQIEPEF